jgi:hypothetical protein
MNGIKSILYGGPEGAMTKLHIYTGEDLKRFGRQLRCRPQSVFNLHRCNLLYVNNKLKNYLYYI